MASIVAAWPTVALGEVLIQDTQYIDSPELRIYPKLSVKLYGRGVVLDAPADGATLKMQRHQIAHAGQVILSEIWGKKGAIGIVPPEGEGALCTSHFFLFDIQRDRLDPKWLQAIFTANYLQGQLDGEARGTTGYAAVRPKHLLSATIPLPPLDEQRRIVARIESLAARIAEARGLRREARQDMASLLNSAYAKIAHGAPARLMSEVAPLRRRPVNIDSAAEYPELGIRSFGRGTFHKPPLPGVLVGTKKLFSIGPGDLLFNIVFAWEGAVAVAQLEDSGRFGSHRFLTCVPLDGVARASYLCYHFLTEVGLDQLSAASPGGAGRNRTLGLKALENISVPIPPYQAQIWFEQLLERAKALELEQSHIDATLDALLPSILDKALRGEL